MSIGVLMDQAATGDPAAAGALFSALYHELRVIAERHLRGQREGVSLGTTSLLHEAFLNMRDREGVQFPDRARFLAYASRAMRGLVIDYVRNRQAKKRGGEFQLITMDEGQVSGEKAEGQSLESLESLSEALDVLASVDALLAELVDLHFFGGFSFTEIAQLRKVSERTVQRDWRKARLLLHHHLQQEG
jgi:RNA polymerase sigma factor (TIGR02999 family)